MPAVRGDGDRRLDDEDDGALAARALRGSAEAWDALVRRHTRRVVVSLLARGVPLDAAEDLAQEAWLRLIERQRQGRLRELELPGLAIAQAGVLALESARTATRRRRLAETGGAHAPEADPGPGPDDRAADRERLAIVEAELVRCPQRAQAIFLAIYGREARSPAEVAVDLGLSLQRVRQSLCETRARLRRALAEREGDGT